MKKIAVLAISTIFTLVLANDLFARSSDPDFKSYSSDFKSGDMAVQLGIGLGHYSVYGDTVVPPLTVSFDYAKPINKLPLSFGGYLGYAQSEEKISYMGFDPITFLLTTETITIAYSYYILWATAS